MRLTALHPRFLGAGGEGIYNADGTPATPRHGIGLLFDCPCVTCSSKRTGNQDDDYQLTHFVHFENPLDGGPMFEDAQAKWKRVGETFDTLQLTPSILSSIDKGGCGWHGYIGLTVHGEVTTV